MSALRFASSAASGVLRCRLVSSTSSVGAASAVAAMPMQRRSVGQRQNAPKGFREAAARYPMSFEFAGEAFALAKTAHQTKNYGDAVSLYDRALSLRREEHGPISLPCAEVLYQIARVFIDMREFGAAENALTESAAIYEQKLTIHSEKYAQSLSLLGYCYSHLKFYEEAEKAFKESIEIYKGLFYNHGANRWIPDDSVEAPKDPNLHPLASVAHCYADMATLLISQGEEAQAVSNLLEALEIRRYLYSRHPKFKPMIAQTLGKLAEIKRAQNDSHAAEMYANECLEMCVETMGRDSPATASAVSTKGSLLAAKKKFKEAIKCFEESATTYAMSFGKDAAMVGNEFVKLARVQEMAEMFREAEKSYVRGTEVLTKALGPKSPQTAEANSFYAMFLMKKSQFDQAATLLKESIAVRKAADPNDASLATLYHRLGECMAAKKDNEAEAYFLQSIEHFTVNSKKEPTHRTLMTDVYDDLGLYYLSHKHLDKAERAFKAALDIRMDAIGDVHPTVAYSYSNFALLYLEQQNAKQCFTMCDMAISTYQQCRNNQSDLAFADVYTTRAQCHEQQRQYDAAIEYHNKALDIRRIRGEMTEPATAESLHSIAKVYIKRKEYANALKFLNEAKKVATKCGDATIELRQQIIATEESIPDPSEWNARIE